MRRETEELVPRAFLDTVTKRGRWKLRNSKNTTCPVFQQQHAPLSAPPPYCFPQALFSYFILMSREAVKPVNSKAGTQGWWNHGDSALPSRSSLFPRELGNFFFFSFLLWPSHGT